MCKYVKCYLLVLNYKSNIMFTAKYCNRRDTVEGQTPFSSLLTTAPRKNPY